MTLPSPSSTGSLQTEPPVPTQQRTAGAVSAVLDNWQSLKENLTSVLAAPVASGEWAARIAISAARIRALALKDPDLALYTLLQSAVTDMRHYSSHHAMFAAVVVDLCTAWLEWPAGEAESGFNAALTMNIAMAELQNRLAEQVQPPSEAQRRAIDEHPRRGAELLQAAGVTDGLWLEVVRGHHAVEESGETGQPRQPSQRLAHLLRRADIFTAKLSRRRSRDGKSGAIAARDACLDPAGQLDEIGATMLRVLGLYPPGSYVQLANGDLAVVTRRGDKAHMPAVVALRRSDGTVVVNLRRRDSADPQYRVTRVARGEELNMVLQHDRILACG